MTVMTFIGILQKLIKFTITGRHPSVASDICINRAAGQQHYFSAGLKFN